MTISVFPPIKEDQLLTEGVVETITKTGVAQFSWTDVKYNSAVNATTVSLTDTGADRGKLGCITWDRNSAAYSSTSGGRTYFLGIQHTDRIKISKISFTPFIYNGEGSNYPTSLPVNSTFTIGLYTDDGTGKPNTAAPYYTTTVTANKSYSAYNRGYYVNNASPEPNDYYDQGGSDPVLEAVVPTPLVTGVDQKIWVGVTFPTNSGYPQWYFSEASTSDRKSKGTALDYELYGGTLYSGSHGGLISATWQNAGLDDIVSTAVTVSNLLNWNSVSFTKNAGSGTIQVDLYDNKGAVLASNISSPYDMSALVVNSVIFKVTMSRSTVAGATPSLTDLVFSWDEGQTAMSGFEGKKPYVFVRQLAATPVVVVDVQNGCGMAVVRMWQGSSIASTTVKIEADGKTVEESTFTPTASMAHYYGAAGISSTATFGSNNRWTAANTSTPMVSIPWVGFTKSLKVTMTSSTYAYGQVEVLM